MDFKKKLKLRLCSSIINIIIGVIMVIFADITKTENTFISSFGIGLIACGIIRIRKYFRITKNDETIKKQQIAENDERNILIMSQAKNITFNMYIFLAGTAIIILEFMNKTDIAAVISYSICGLVFIYWVTYWVMNKKC